MEQPVEKYYTYADTLSWDEDTRVEIIDGKLYMMPSPLRIHQEVLFEIAGQIREFLKGKTCKAYIAPSDVRLFEQDNDDPDKVDTVVQPDIFVVCDKNKLDKYGCKGAPDLIIEILSPSTAPRDRFVKLNLYNRAKVSEYWVVDPFNCTVEVLLPSKDGNLTLTAVYSRKDKAPITVLPGCEIDLSTALPDPDLL